MMNFTHPTRPVSLICRFILIHTYFLKIYIENVSTKISYLCACLSAVCLPACLPACLPVCLPACLPCLLPACLPACLPAACPKRIKQSDHTTMK
jgi:hypothetical protein